MAFFYIKDDGSAESGTATGDGGRYVVQKTGDWTTAFTATTEYYASFYVCEIATTPPTGGDIIFVSHLHNASVSPPNIVNFSDATVVQLGIRVVSVDDTDCAVYKPGAYELMNTNTYTYRPTGNLMMAGVSFEGLKNTLTADADLRKFVLQDCTLSVTGDLEYFLYLSQQGVDAHIINVDMDMSAAAGYGVLMISSGARLVWDGGAFIGTGSIAIMFNSSFMDDGGGSAIFNGVDVSMVAGALCAQGNASTEDTFLVRYNKCKISPTATLPTPGTDLQLPSHRFEMFNCDDGTSDEFHRFYVATGSGSAQNNDSVYITSGKVWASNGVNSSIQVKTSSRCDRVMPFTFELLATYSNLASSTKVIVNMVTDAVLTDTKIAAFLVYPDGTINVQANWVTSGRTYDATTHAIDPLHAGTTLPASSLGAADWTGEPISPNFYKLELDTSSDPGIASAVSVRIEVYYDFTGDGDVLYISPELEVAP